MTILAAVLWLHATGFYPEPRGSWQLLEYPSLVACESDRAHQAQLAEWRGLRNVMTTCRAIEMMER